MKKIFYIFAIVAFMLTSCDKNDIAKVAIDTIVTHMQNNQTGSIINIASIVGVFGNIGQANYAASKAGVIGLTKTWAKEFGMKGGNVRVNAIAPGYVMTDILKTVPQDLLDKFAAMTMLGRLGQPEDVSGVISFLVSKDASFITAETIQIGGGQALGI